MLLNRRVQSSGIVSQSVPVRIVLFASSLAVNKGNTLAGTAGLLDAFKAVKSPPKINEVGMLLALTRTGAKSQRRSYESRKNVWWRDKGNGPPNDPPVSFKLK